MKKLKRNTGERDLMERISLIKDRIRESATLNDNNTTVSFITKDKILVHLKIYR